jgi:16S rRNA (adenine1518-N6/adenine1519-N6)-dimethyltransferase
MNNQQILPTIQEVIKIYNLSPNKKLGQNFLLDTDITDKIVLSAGNLQGFNVLEIGPGAGTLTRSILASKAEKVYAVEMDIKCVAALESLIALNRDRLQVIKGDALKINEEEIIQIPTKIIANLPYNIGTELILKWLSRPHLFTSITVMLQQEVVDRIVAKPSTPHYGRLSIICQYLCEVEKRFDVAPHHFYPPPKVISSVVNLKPLAKPLYDCDLNKLNYITQVLFNQRRKMIRATLKNYITDLDATFKKLNIDPCARPENLKIEEFCALSNVIRES